MSTDLLQFLETISEHPEASLIVVFIASVAEAAFGLGAILPGETVLVVAAIALRETPALAVAAIVAAVGAFAGDHIGYLIGRKLGPRMTRTRVVRKIGVDRWHAAMRFVERRGFWLIVVARLLPGIRTLIAAAAGASPMRYRRFALASGTAVVAWSAIWVFGGAALGGVLIEYAEHLTIPSLVTAAVAVIAAIVVRRIRASA